MALMFKLVIGAGAVGSAILIAASERNTEPIKAMIVPEFAERFPVMVPPPSPTWRTNAVVPVDVAATASVEIEPRPVASPSKVRQSGFVCHRVYFTQNSHRYWRCRR
jgi:hypothetical protein